MGKELEMRNGEVVDADSSDSVDLEDMPEGLAVLVDADEATIGEIRQRIREAAGDATDRVDWVKPEDTDA